MPPHQHCQSHPQQNTHCPRSSSPCRPPSRKRPHFLSKSPARTRSRSRSRSRSPSRKNHYDADLHKPKTRRAHSPRKPVKLPFKAKPVSKRQYEDYQPLFQSYLDIQKQIRLDELDEREVAGRWKSFVRHWNRGDLARGWYDPAMLKSAQETMQAFGAETHRVPVRRQSPEYGTTPNVADDSDDDFGPAPPTDALERREHGPAIPRLDDLAHRDELNSAEHARNRAERGDHVRFERKAERAVHKARLEELAPRADAGSRERQLEKKREATSTLQSFRDAKEGGDAEVAEADLMGDDGVDLYKRKKREEQRKLTEREIRREEIARAREAERNERLSERREKEEKTMDYLRQLARERFG